MKQLIKLIFFILFSLYNYQSFAAVQIVECEDEQGNRSFEKSCPPGTSQVGSKKISTGGAGKVVDSKDNISAIIYTVPECDTCEEVKEFLNTRNISITEKNAKEDISIQKELTEIAGALKVPTTIIGETILSGYNRKEFLSALKALGYEE